MNVQWQIFWPVAVTSQSIRLSYIFHILRLNIANFAVAEGWLLLDIGWFVLFFPSISWHWYLAGPPPNDEWFPWSICIGCGCQQGTLTLQDTWFLPPFLDLLMLQLLRPVFPNLPCLFSTFHLEYPSVLSRFVFFLWYKTQDQVLHVSNLTYCLHFVIRLFVYYTGIYMPNSCYLLLLAQRKQHRYSYIRFSCENWLPYTAYLWRHMSIHIFKA